MFTGLIEEVGMVSSIRRAGDGYSIKISAEKVLDDLKVM